MALEWIAGAIEIHVVRQRDWQIALRHRHDAAALAVDHWNRTAPVTLARYAPVAQTKIDLAGPNRNVAVRDPLKPSRDLFLCFLYAQAIEKARIDHAAVAFIGGIGDDEDLGILSRRTNDGRVAEAVFVDEVEVALVVCRAAEDRSRAVLHHDEVGDIDWKLPVWIEGVESLHSGVETVLLGSIYQLLRGAVASGFRNERGERRVFGRSGGGKRMIGRESHELGAEQRIMARGEDFELVLRIRRCGGIKRKADEQAL